MGDGGFMTREYEYWYGSFTKQGEGGRLDHFLVDAANLALFEAGQPFEAMVVAQDNEGADLQLALPVSEALYMVLYNPAVTSHMVGSLDASLAPAEGTAWSTEPEPVSTRFQIPPQGWVSVALEP